MELSRLLGSSFLSSSLKEGKGQGRGQGEGAQVLAFTVMSGAGRLP